MWRIFGASNSPTPLGVHRRVRCFIVGPLCCLPWGPKNLTVLVTEEGSPPERGVLRQMGGTWCLEIPESVCQSGGTWFRHIWATPKHIWVAPRHTLVAPKHIWVAPMHIWVERRTNPDAKVRFWFQEMGLLKPLIGQNDRLDLEIDLERWKIITNHQKTHDGND